jgi:hypothetical protein
LSQVAVAVEMVMEEMLQVAEVLEVLELEAVSQYQQDHPIQLLLVQEVLIL